MEDPATNDDEGSGRVPPFNEADYAPGSFGIGRWNRCAEPCQPRECHCGRSIACHQPNPVETQLTNCCYGCALARCCDKSNEEELLPDTSATPLHLLIPAPSIIPELRGPGRPSSSNGYDALAQTSYRSSPTKTSDFRARQSLLLRWTAETGPILEWCMAALQSLAGRAPFCPPEIAFAPFRTR